MLINESILIATKHNKDSVIAPALKRHLNAIVNTTTDFDTDKYGTFDGSVKRTSLPYETALAKAKDAAQLYNYRYVVASEGSFGPHSRIPFIPGNVEHLLFYDASLDKAICEVEVTTSTNFAHLDVSQSDSIDAFLAKIKFGSHAVNLRDITKNIVLVKEVKDREHLDRLLLQYFTVHDVIRLETDMRAMMNPTRMQVIAGLAERLAARLSRSCPQCSFYGFGEISAHGRLECSLCGSETTMYKLHHIECIFCSHIDIAMRPDGLEKADPTYCEFCNP